MHGGLQGKWPNETSQGRRRMLKTCAAVVNFLLSNGHNKFFFITIGRDRRLTRQRDEPSCFASLVLPSGVRRISPAPHHRVYVFLRSSRAASLRKNHCWPILRDRGHVDRRQTLAGTYRADSRPPDGDDAVLRRDSRRGCHEPERVAEPRPPAPDKDDVESGFSRT